ncbi:hypothetical protein FXO37_16142 [Capsicum annuum]|nr:hypothetical protein FXO37_16142 [Capsicum annuum]
MVRDDCSLVLQDKFYNQATFNLSKASGVDKVAKFTPNAIGNSNYAAVKAGFTVPKTDQTTRTSFKSYRFFNALKGHGALCRLVILPYESHGYAARENIMHVLRVTYSIDTLGLKKESAIAIDISMDVNVVVIYLAIVIAGVIYSIDTLGLKKESAIAIDMPMVVNVVVIYLAIVIAG